MLHVDVNCILEILCGQPPNGANTEVPEVSVLYNEQYTYKCITGYRTSDETTTECLANGTFNLQNLPNCTSECLEIIMKFFLRSKSIYSTIFKKNTCTKY